MRRQARLQGWRKRSERSLLAVSRYLDHKRRWVLSEGQTGCARPVTLGRRERAEAEAELDVAIEFYASKRSHLAVEFLDAVEAGIAHILEWPDSGRPYPGREGRAQVLRTTRVNGKELSAFTESTLDEDVYDPHQGCRCLRLTQNRHGTSVRPGVRAS